METYLLGIERRAVCEQLGGLLLGTALQAGDDRNLTNGLSSDSRSVSHGSDRDAERLRRG